MMRVLLRLIRTIGGVFFDLLVFFRLNLRSAPAPAAENLFLRKQLSLYVERKKKPRRATDSARFTLAQLSRLFEWRDALTVVKPDTDSLASERLSIVLEYGSPDPSAVHRSSPMFGS
jgi:hypothetical protein